MGLPELYNKEMDGITSEDQIEDYFKDCGGDLFEQNTTDCSEEESCVIKLDNQDKYYDVTVKVSLVGAWQDVGDKLYTIDTIDSVTYKEVEYNDLMIQFNTNIFNKIEYYKKQIVELENQIMWD